MALLSLSGYAGSGKDTAGNILQWLLEHPTAPEVTQGKDRSFNSFQMDIGMGYNPVWQIKKWAGPLRKVAAILLAMDEEYLYTDEFKKSTLPDCWNYLHQATENEPCNVDGYSTRQMTGREFLQKLGTDAVRDGLHQQAWVNALMNEYDSQFGYSNDLQQFINPYWIITDTRFPNELSAVKERSGVTIRINRAVNHSVPPKPDGILKAYEDRLHPSETALDNSSFDFVVDNNGTIRDLHDKLLTIIQSLNYGHNTDQTQSNPS